MPGLDQDQRRSRRSMRGSIHVWILSRLKDALVPGGLRPRKVLCGLNRGLVMWLDLRHDLQRQLGLYEREISYMFRKYARNINTAVDVGAGDGFYTLYFLARTSATNVFAFEPSEEARRRMARNLQANGLDLDPRLVLDPRPVGAQTQVGAVTLDSIWERVRTPCLIKIDAEGAEANVLAGAGHILGLPEVLWIVETHSRRLERECVSLLSSRGHETVIARNALWRTVLPESRPMPHNRWLFARVRESSLLSA